MPEFPWQVEEGGIKRLRDMDLLECLHVHYNVIYYERPHTQLKDYILQKGLEDIPLPKAIRNILMRGAPASLKCPVLTTGPHMVIGENPK